METPKDQEGCACPECLAAHARLLALFTKFLEIRTTVDPAKREELFRSIATDLTAEDVPSLLWNVSAAAKFHAMFAEAIIVKKGLGGFAALTSLLAAIEESRPENPSDAKKN